MSTAAALSVVVPTYGRESVLVETLHRLRALDPPADEILVIDQTIDHDEATSRGLESLARCGGIRWLRRPGPSIPGAMNQGLCEAGGDRVLFVDDDVEPDTSLVGAHLDAAERHGEPVIVAGQVLQPGQEPALSSSGAFRFNSTEEQEVEAVMGGNFSVRREFAIQLGGFDENFVGAAYRFEAEFCLRARRAGARIWFEPAAGLRHLRAERGDARLRVAPDDRWPDALGRGVLLSPPPEAALLAEACSRPSGEILDDALPPLPSVAHSGYFHS